MRESVEYLFGMDRVEQRLRMVMPRQGESEFADYLTPTTTFPTARLCPNESIAAPASLNG